ncbi:MAG TPA: hypothetical protein ENH65_15055, partial [Candidatus Aminicenantes bacterium]|nr:hypothetical protein [Candidatus Aminicenantes bacterium]
MNIEYTAVPTMSQLHHSNAFYRGIMGPVRSGKSTGCSWELWRRANEQKPMKGGVRRTRFGIIRNCYDDQTEILTENRGWQLFKDLLEDDKVAALVGDNLVYQQPNRVARFPYKGEMIGFEGENVDFLVTPDHKMWVSTRTTRKKIWGKYEIRTAEEIYGSQLVRLKRNSQWVGVETDLSPDVFEWLGFWFAEGSVGEYRNQKRITITQVNDIDYTRDLFERAGIAWREWKRKPSGINFVVDKESELFERLWLLLKDAGKARTKKIPVELLHAPKEHLQAFLAGMIKGDGTVGKSTCVKISSQILADQLQEIAVKAGFVANVNKEKDYTGREIVFDGIVKGHTNGPQYCVTFVKPQKYRPLLLCDKNSTRRRGWYKEQYDGEVFCVEMPPIPVYVRRKGKGFWCLRTYRELLDTTVKTWLDWFREEHVGRFNKHSMTHNMRWNDIDCEVLFRALDRPGDISKLLSMELTGAWVNEAREVPKGVIDTLGDRVGQFPAKKDGGCTWEGVLLDTNPPDDDHWWYEMAEEQEYDGIPVDPSAWQFFRQAGGIMEVDGKFIPNPDAENIGNLNQGAGYYLKRLPGKKKSYIRVYYCAQYGYVQEGKPVHEEYVEHVHCAKEVIWPVQGLPIVIGIDFGLCYDGETEVLTLDGWKYFKDVDAEKDVVATRNPDNGVIEYNEINFKTAQHYKGKMLEWHNSTFSVCITPEHRVPFTFRDTPEKVEFAPAQWLADNQSGHHYVDLCAKWDHYDDIDKTYGPLDWSALLFAEFMGIWLSEGSVEDDSPVHRISIHQKENSPRINKILDDTGLSWHRNDNSWRASNK